MALPPRPAPEVEFPETAGQDHYLDGFAAVTVMPRQTSANLGLFRLSAHSRRGPSHLQEIFSVLS